jgi:hypothetical protein
LGRIDYAGKGDTQKKRTRTGGTWACIATGPSLEKSQCDLIRQAGVNVCAVNDAYVLAPFADVVYGTDLRWWQIHYARVVEACQGELYTADPSAKRTHPWAYDRLKIVEGEHGNGLAEAPPIHYGSNSGYAAVNLIYALYDAARIILVGYDMGYHNGQPHYFGNHPEGLQVKSPFQEFIRRFNTIDPAKCGIEIINATVGGNLECFPRAQLSEVLISG